VDLYIHSPIRLHGAAQNYSSTIPFIGPRFQSKDFEFQYSCPSTVGVPGYRARGPGSIPGATTFSERWWIWSGVHSASWVQLGGLLGRKSNGSGLEIQEYGRRDPSRWPHGTLYPQMLALTSPTRSGRSIGVVRSRTWATELLVTDNFAFCMSSYLFFKKWLSGWTTVDLWFLLEIVIQAASWTVTTELWHNRCIEDCGLTLLPLLVLCAT
jgi:hypothetical protein